MIVETVVDLFFTVITYAFQGLEIIGLPYQLINSLATILSYGTWIVGADILALFTAMVVGWWTIKFAVGLVVFIWELLPLT